MTEAQLVEAISAQFVAAFATLRPALASYIALEGESFDAADSWVRVSIIPVDGEQRSLGAAGSRIVEDRGFIAVQVFSPVNAGAVPRAALCDDVRTALQFQRLTTAGVSEPVYVYNGVSRTPSTDGRWMSQLVVFEYSACKTA